MRMLDSPRILRISSKLVSNEDFTVGSVLGGSSIIHASRHELDVECLSFKVFFPLQLVSAENGDGSIL